MEQFNAYNIVLVLLTIALFVLTLLALRFILFKPLFTVMEERHRRTEGVMAEATRTLDYYKERLERYQGAIREARMAAYRHQEQARAEALSRRAEIIARAREQAEREIEQAKAELSQQVARAKVALERDAREIAEAITLAVLQRELSAREERL